MSDKVSCTSHLANPRDPQISTKIYRQLLPPAAKNPFEKGFLDLPKLFNWDGLDTVFFFVSLRVTSWLKLDGGFWSIMIIEKHPYFKKIEHKFKIININISKENNYE